MEIIDKLTEEQEQVLIGSLLGDGCLTYMGKTSVNVSFTEKHSLAQEKYLLWKKQILDNSFNIKVLYGTTTKTLFNRKTPPKTYYYCMIRTNNSSDLTKIYPKIYFNNKKNPKFLLDNLKDLGLAIWFCDDGCYFYRGKSYSLNHPKEWQKQLIKYFNKKKIYPKKTRDTRIIFNVKDSKKIKQKINKYIFQMPSDIHYKSGELLELIEKARIAKKLCDKKYVTKNYKKLQLNWKNYYYNVEKPIRHLKNKKNKKFKGKTPINSV